MFNQILSESRVMFCFSTENPLETSLDSVYHEDGFQRQATPVVSIHFCSVLSLQSKSFLYNIYSFVNFPLSFFLSLYFWEQSMAPGLSF